MHKDYIKMKICQAIDELNFKESKIIQDIQTALKEYNGNDFETVEKIVEILEENGIECGNCHDF